MEDDTQERLYREMERPGFYAGGVERVDLEETHISRVFLTGRIVYKVKKAVDLGFLDFSTLEKRRRFCEREVALNRRLSTGVYLGVTPICRAGTGFVLGGDGPPVEYAVRMRQLPSERSLASRIRDGSVTPGIMAPLARRLGVFYERAGPSPPKWSETARDRLEAACRENFRQSEGAVGGVLDPGRFHAVRTATASYFERRGTLLDRRARAGMIRDGHGDLRTGHVYFLEGGEPQIIDCIEFSDALRHIDIASDLAFLAMDLDDWGRRDLGAALIAAYVRDSGDLGAYAPLPFYQCYRAMVRCKVAVIRHRAEAGEGSASTPWSREAERYLRLAHDYALRYSRPTIWAVLGVPASGKSTMARGLADALSVDVLSSDVVRKRIFGLAPTEAAATSPDRGIYSPEATRRTYAELLGSARQAIAEGRSVVLDATFGSEGDRREVRDLAGGRSVPVRFVLCTAPKEVLLSRLGERRDGESVSDARPRHFDALRRRFQPVSGEGAPLFQADTVRSLDACLRGILDWDYRLPVEPSERQWACPPANTGG